MSEEAAPHPPARAFQQAWRDDLGVIRLIETLAHRVVARARRLNAVPKIAPDPWCAAINHTISAKFIIAMSEGEMGSTMSEEAAYPPLLSGAFQGAHDAAPWFADLSNALQDAWREPLGRIRYVDKLAKKTMASLLHLSLLFNTGPDSPLVPLFNETRAKFVKELEQIGPPMHFRVIHCRRTIKKQQVVLINWHRRRVAYTAVSHTFGMDVYGVFDCECASRCDADVPRCSRQACPGHDDVNGAHAKIIRDILSMCVRLRSAGAKYVWHDGVCIAQHDEAEVRETIQHMGWIYGHAKETVIFLHYIGNPVAPIRHDGELISRWVTRVWTLQEAALSACRRYCFRRGGNLGHCQNLKHLEAEIARWYEDDSTIAVVEEDEYLAILRHLHANLCRLVRQEMLQISDPVRFLSESWRRMQNLCDSTSASSDFTRTAAIATLDAVRNWSSVMRDAMNQIGPSLDLLEKSRQWLDHLIHLHSTCMDTCIKLPTVEEALSLNSFRDSKHEGDRINSILALAGVRGFVAPKDGDMKSSTIEFFKRQGQDGLGRAVFSVNLQGQEEDSWVPCLSGQLQPIQTDAIRSTLCRIRNGCDDRPVGTADYIHYEVLQNGRIELSGDLGCLSVEFTFKEGQRRKISRRAGSWSDQSAIRMDLHCVDAICANGFTAYRGHAHMGRADVTVHNCQPVIRGGVVEDGESFHAHLVYPVPALLIRRNLEAESKLNKMDALPGVSEILNSVPALLIQGDLGADAAFSKVGHFYVYPALRSLLLGNNLTTAITHLNRLVLK